MTVQEKITLMERILRHNPNATVKHFMDALEWTQFDQRRERREIYNGYANQSRLLNEVEVIDRRRRDKRRSFKSKIFK